MSPDLKWRAVNQEMKNKLLVGIANINGQQHDAHFVASANGTQTGANPSVIPANIDASNNPLRRLGNTA